MADFWLDDGVFHAIEFSFTGTVSSRTLEIRGILGAHVQWFRHWNGILLLHGSSHYMRRALTLSLCSAQIIQVRWPFISPKFYRTANLRCSSGMIQETALAMCFSGTCGSAPVRLVRPAACRTTALSRLEILEPRFGLFSRVYNMKMPPTVFSSSPHCISTFSRICSLLPPEAPFF